MTSTTKPVHKKVNAARAAAKCADAACEVLEELGRPEGREVQAGVRAVKEAALEQLGVEGVDALAAGDFNGVLAAFFKRRAKR